MKKILFLLLLATTWMQAQTYQNPTFGTVTTKTAPTSTTPPTIATVEATGIIGKITPENIPINQPPHPINYTVPSPTLGGHLKGIDDKIGQMGQTTAGVTNRIYFTGDNTTVNSIVYFASSATGKGSTPSASPPNLVNGDDQKQYFTKDIIGIAQPANTISAPGTYNGQLSVMVDSEIAQERYTVEIYKTNNLGVPIASGITGAPVGDLGVTVITILDSGILDLSASAVTNITVSGVLAEQLTLNAGERVRYHVSAAKVGTAGSNVTFTVYYGSNYSSYYDVPVTTTTDGVVNKSTVAGLTTTNALNTLNTTKIGGSGVSGQVSFWNGTNTQTGDNSLFWDNTNKRLGIGTIAPDWVLTINRPVASSLKVVNTASSGSSAGATVTLHSDDAAAISDGDRLGAYAFGGRYDVSNVANSVGGIYAFAKGNWTSINNAPADIHVQTRQLGTNNTMAIFGSDGVFYLGTTSGNISNDPAMLIKRNITGSSGLNAHAYVDESIINRDGTIGYNSYDCKTEIQGTFTYDHFAGFQSRPRFASSGNIDRLVGYQSLPYTSTTGTVNNIFSFDAYDPTGTGTVTNNYGLHVRTLTRGTNNWGVYVQTNNSYFGGKIISNNTIRLKSYTVATLPSGTQGDTAYVTDATAPAYLGALTGGGSVVCPVFYNGTAWVSH